MKFEVKAPEAGESITEVTIARWLKEEGDLVHRDEPLCEIESEKATLELVAEESGRLERLVPEGEIVSPGTIIARIDTSVKVREKEPAKEVESEQPIPAPERQRAKEEKVSISPVAKKIIEEEGIDEKQLRELGATKRITKDMVLQLLEKKDASNGNNEPLAAFIEGQETRRERREKMSTLRRTIARRLLEARQNTAMLTTFNEADMSAVISLRKQFQESFVQKYGIKLGFMSFFVKAATMALQEFPVINARLEEQEIVYHDYVDMGVAVSTDRGLVVPVIRDAHLLSLDQIEKEIARLAEKARQNKLSIDEMSGGTFSITNGGVFGSLLSTPLINIPQSAILGLHNIVDRPVAVDGRVVIRPMMYLALSYDHRLIDGKDSVQFLLRIKELIEDPVRLLLKV